MYIQIITSYETAYHLLCPCPLKQKAFASVFPGAANGKESACHRRSTRDTGSIPGSGRSCGEGNGTPLQYSCLENSMDRLTLQARVHGATKSWTQLSTQVLSLPGLP